MCSPPLLSDKDYEALGDKIKWSLLQKESRQKRVTSNHYIGKWATDIIACHAPRPG
jgi:hypothetical protein